MAIRNEKGQFVKGHEVVSVQKMRETILQGYANGRTVWNTGKPWSAEIKEKLRLSHLGIKQTPESIEKRIKSNTGKKRTREFKEGQSLRMSGKNNHRWRGGVSTEREKISNTNQYRAWRKSVFERDDYTCVICHERGGKLNADHIIPYFKNKELVFDINNGQTLCEKCHLEKTRKEMKENWVNQYASKSCWSVLK